MANRGSIGAEINIETGVISLPYYLFPSKKARHIEAADIDEVINWFPPAIRMKDRELLFVSREQVDELEAFCLAHQIKFGSRYDTWSDLLAPFLDTELSYSSRKGIYRNLTSAGFSKVEIREIRQRVSRRMWNLTFATWEWQHYGLYDLLLSSQPRWFRTRPKWRRFYEQSMEIANKGIEL